MKKIAFFLIVLLAVAMVGKSLVPPKSTSAFDIAGFGQLPVVANGRVKPLDTVARSTLLQLQSRQEVRNTNVREPVVASPTEWLLDVFYRPDKADTYQMFLVEHLEHVDVAGLIGRTPENLKIEYTSPVTKTLAIMDMVPKTQKRFSFNELAPHLANIGQQAQLASAVEAQLRTPFQNSALALARNLRTYIDLKHTVIPPGHDHYIEDVMKLQDDLPKARAAVSAKMANQPHDEALADGLIELANHFDQLAQTSKLLVAPPDTASGDITEWQNTGAAFFDTFATQRVNSTALAYVVLGRSWANNQPTQFNELLGLLRNSLEKRFEERMVKTDAETRFNAAEPFYTAIRLYALAFFTAITSWLFWPRELGRAAFWVTAIAWVVSTIGILTRMWLEGRPPVTNLYSSALFIGWGAVGLCLLLEYFFKNAIPTVAAGVVGFCTLIIAHHLSLSGDTLEMMQAVLDTNLWLATHVVIVTAGYSGTFLAGFLALIYLVLGIFTPLLSRPFERATAKGVRVETTGDTLNRMVYGIICFATIASFVGTVLGGIWADQSWGRFWGWDPKENGALLIVLWNAVILHARWGGMIRQRGLMNMAIFGNIVTSWSWFGTNMLGVGLHSYGFTGAAFMALLLFVCSQLAFIALGSLPLEKWRSFRKPTSTPTPPPASGVRSGSAA